VDQVSYVACTRYLPGAVPGRRVKSDCAKDMMLTKKPQYRAARAIVNEREKDVSYQAFLSRSHAGRNLRSPTLNALENGLVTYFRAGSSKSLQNVSLGG
jgi:hypothetical protein